MVSLIFCSTLMQQILFVYLVIQDNPHHKSKRNKDVVATILFCLGFWAICLIVVAISAGYLYVGSLFLNKAIDIPLGSVIIYNDDVVKLSNISSGLNTTLDVSGSKLNLSIGNCKTGINISTKEINKNGSVKARVATIIDDRYLLPRSKLLVQFQMSNFNIEGRASCIAQLEIFDSDSERNNFIKGKWSKSFASICIKTTNFKYSFMSSRTPSNYNFAVNTTVELNFTISGLITCYLPSETPYVCSNSCSIMQSTITMLNAQGDVCVLASRFDTLQTTSLAVYSTQKPHNCVNFGCFLFYMLPIILCCCCIGLCRGLSEGCK